MKNSNPLVSVVMSTYNRQEYLPFAVESIINQEYENWELIVVDDGSSDESLKILNNYANKDKRIKLLVNQKNLGIAKSLNRGIKQAEGKYLAIMDSDDLSQSNRLIKQVEYLENQNSIVALGSWMQEIDKVGEVVGYRKLPCEDKKIREMMGYAMGIQHPTTMFNKSLIPENFEWYKHCGNSIGGFVGDLDLFFRLMKYGKLANIPEYLCQYRIAGQNETLSKIKETFWTAVEVRERAIREYNYKPSKKVAIIFQLSKIIVRVVPEDWLMKIYKWLRR